MFLNVFFIKVKKIMFFVFFICKVMFLTSMPNIVVGVVLRSSNLPGEFS